MRKKILHTYNNSEISRSDKWDGFRLGSEACPLLLPGKDLIQRVAEMFPPDKLSLVTPLSGQGDLDLVLSTAELALSLGFSELVVNDWGVLREFSGEGRGKLTAGRLLLRFRRGPGQFDTWDEMDNESRRYFAWGPLYDSAFMAFLSGLGVGRLELDPPRHWQNIPVPSGFDLSFHGQYRLVSVAAICPWRSEVIPEKPEAIDTCSRCLETGPVFLDSKQIDRPLLQWGPAILEDAGDDWSDKNLPPEVDRIIYEGELLSGTVSASYLRI